jgi:hypothetical protein
MLSTISEKLAEVLGVAFLHSCTEHIVGNMRELSIALTHGSVYRSRQIRVSMAEILSIKNGDKYVLIDNINKPERVAPIGGVVRYFDSVAPMLEDKIEFEPEYKAGARRYDLRGFIQGKNFSKFLRWYGTGIDREHSALAREIEEEFLEIGIRDITNVVRRPEFETSRIVFEGPKKVTAKQYWQYRQFTVYELREKQSDVSKILAHFIRSHLGKSRRLVSVSADEIRNGKTMDGRLIGNSAGYLFGGRAVGVPPLFESH